MLSIYLMTYAVPAAGFSIAIWMLFRLLREFSLSIAMRRIIFVISSTIFLAPSMIPAGIILVALVPNGVLLLSGDLPMLHQPRLVTFSTLSVSITALLAYFASRLFIREGQSRPLTKSGRIANATVSIAVVATLLTFYYSQIPDRKIPARIDWALIETNYGAQMDALAATLDIDDLQELRLERERIKTRFANDPTIVLVKFSDSRLKQENTGRTFFSRLPKRTSSSSSCSTLGDGMYSNNRLMRCTHNRNTETLKFRRDGWNGKNNNLIEIDFDYELFMQEFPQHQHAPTVHEESLDKSNIGDYDDFVTGTWKLQREGTGSTSEEVREFATMHVDHRVAPGRYEIAISMRFESTLLAGESFANAACDNSQTSCTWSAASTGFLTARGSQVQIIYDEANWTTDILTLRNNVLLGRDAQGGTLRFEKTAGNSISPPIVDP